MKTIGLLGGMSWESTVYYYTVINQLINERLGGYSSAKIIMNSVDFNPIEKLQTESEWKKLDEMMVEESIKISNAGADVLLICTNTMHNCYEAINETIDIPIIHIADSTGSMVKKEGITKIGLLGTIYTMEKEFYKGRLSEKYELELVIPEANERKIVNEIIFNELVFGKINEQSKGKYQTIISNLQENGAQGIILGCTEIPLLIKKDDVSVPVFDTTYLHAEAAVNFALEND